VSETSEVKCAKCNCVSHCMDTLETMAGRLCMICVVDTIATLTHERDDARAEVERLRELGQAVVDAYPCTTWDPILSLGKFLRGEA